MMGKLMRKRKEEEQSHPEEEEVIEADGRHIEVQLVQEKQPVILVEIVSALYLPSNDRFSEADPYIVVYFEEEEVHRTKAIWNARNPIWTVENGSLFLFQLPPNHDDDDNDDVEAPNNTNSSTTTTISNDHQKKSRLHFLTKTKLKPSTPEPHLSFVLKDYDPLSKNERIGEVKVPLKKLLAGTGKRKELPIETNVDFMNKSVRLGYTPPVLKSTKQPKLMLRYKPASEEDIMFMNTFDEMNIGIFCNEVYLPTVRSTKKTSPKHIHHHHRLSVKDWGGKLFHHSQKSNDSATTPQKQQPALKDPALEEAMLPSQEWIDVGSGNNGKLFLEVIACDDLPNLDAGTSITKCNMNDTFCCLVLEDSIVNTSYIKDSLSPRWQPDDRRAFIFHMHQPSSPLLIGVFDYDKVTVVSKHMTKSRSIYDAVGRVIVNLTQFCPNTIYTLHYELYEADIDSCITREQQQHRGTLTIRLRIKWGDQCCGANESRNMLLSGLMPPQNFYVSLPHREDFQTAHYTTSAEHDTAVFSMKILTAYIAELMDYIDDDMLGMILDAVSTVLLWRGHWKIPIWRSHFTINLPLHSMTAFTWGVLVTQDYNRFPAFLAFCIAWFFLATMEYRRNHPSPWHRCKSYGYLLWTLVAGPLCCCNGGNCFESVTIQANENLPAIKAYLAEIEERKAEKARRKQATLDAAQVEETLLNKEMELDLGLEGDVKITSERKTTVMLSMNPLKPILYPVQQILAHVCIYLRIVKSIITWEENYYAFWIVTMCFLASLLMFFVPWGWILRWVIRLAVWVFLGPWMKIVDWLYFEKLDHMTEEERKEILRESLHTKYEHTVRERSLYQERKERALKLKSMMRYLFGKYLVRVPKFREARFLDIPLPQSTAEPYCEESSEDIITVGQICGQALIGDMIPKRMLPDHPLLPDANMDSSKLDEGAFVTEKDDAGRSVNGEKEPLLSKMKRKKKNLYGLFKKR